MAHDYDVIVVGSGIAGLSFALRIAAKDYTVAIITKKTRAESNTNYAQGGIACVTSEGDDFEFHVRDTLEAGDGLCDESVVREIVSDGPARIQELIDLGVHFSQLNDGRPSLGKEGGHSKRRILHVQDITGKAIESALLGAVARMKNITTLEHFFAIDLIKRSTLVESANASPSKDDIAVGLYALDVRTGVVESFRSRVVLMATGGAGQAYQYTTNPDIATGDGIAMAYRAGVEIENMEFIQFHPTTLYSKTDERFLISEAVRGEGAILRNTDKQAFMKNYHPQADLAPRDIVARAIDSEMKKSGAHHLWLDITKHSAEVLKDRFPTIYNTCIQHGINIAQEFIPVVPAAHYLCGGIKTNTQAETSLNGLFACGEVACTGLHGANRLASNSLLEAVVLAHNGAESVLNYLGQDKEETLDLPDWIDGDVQDSDERVILSHNSEELKRTMWDYVAIVRTTKRLERAQTRIHNLAKEIEDYYWNFKVEPRLLELRNLIQVAELIVKCALQRKESRGLHYILDHPDKNTDPKNTYLRKCE